MRNSRAWQDNALVSAFPLSLEKITRDYTRLPPDLTDVLYHYTTRAGLRGILESGGLRATYRLHMNDLREFNYARDLFYQILTEVDAEPGLPRVVHSITEYVHLNLERMRDESIDNVDSYCACMTRSSDHPGQWERYGDDGSGFALGFNVGPILNANYVMAREGKKHLHSLTVLYEPERQKDLVRGLIRAGIRDMQRFMETASKQSWDLTHLRDRITREIIVCLHSFKDFMKDPMYAGEKEMRFMLNTPDLRVPRGEVQYFGRGGESIPYLFFDLRSPITHRLTLKEITIGPNATFAKELGFVQGLLDDLGYGRGEYQDRPRIVPSSVSGW